MCTICRKIRDVLLLLAWSTKLQFYFVKRRKVIERRKTRAWNVCVFMRNQREKKNHTKECLKVRLIESSLNSLVWEKKVYFIFSHYLSGRVQVRRSNDLLVGLQRVLQPRPRAHNELKLVCIHQRLTQSAFDDINDILCSLKWTSTARHRKNKINCSTHSCGWDILWMDEKKSCIYCMYSRKRACKFAKLQYTEPNRTHIAPTRRRHHRCSCVASLSSLRRIQHNKKMYKNWTFFFLLPIYIGQLFL